MRLQSVSTTVAVVAACLVAPLSQSVAKTYSVTSAGSRALRDAVATASSGDTVLVDKGTYRGPLALNPGVVLKARTLHGAVLEGKGRGTVLTLARKASVEGFVIRNGTIGVFSKAAGGRIVECQVVNNRESGIACVGHLPEIVDNIIAFNGGSGILGWDVRMTSGVVSHNTIAYNRNNGVSVGGVSEVVVDNCILAFNGQYGLKCEGNNVRVTLRQCNLYRNGTAAEMPAADNVSSDPLFVDPYSLKFGLRVGSECIRGGSNREDLGARALTSN